MRYYTPHLSTVRSLSVPFFATLTVALALVQAPSVAQTYGAFTDLHDFGNGSTLDGYAPSGPLCLRNGNLYGATIAGVDAAWPDLGDGGYWEYTATHQYQSYHIPGTRFNFITVDSQGNKFGTTSAGGQYNHGTLWEVDASGVYKDLHDFGAQVKNANGTIGLDGQAPAGFVIDASGNFYGVALQGGPNGNIHTGAGAGMVWKLTAAGVYTDLHDFGGTIRAHDGTIVDGGDSPLARVVIDTKGNLLGTCYNGGAYTNNTNTSGYIWQIAPNGTFLDLHDFGGTITAGSVPVADGFDPGYLSLDSTGNLLGACISGGFYGRGMVWKLSSAGVYSNLHDFGGTNDGTYINLVPTLDADGNLFGIAEGGQTNYGLIWEMSHSGSYSIVHSFNTSLVTTVGTIISDFSLSTGPLLIDTDGTMYGAAYTGGAFGIIYQYPSGGYLWKMTKGAFTPTPAGLTATPGEGTMLLKWSTSAGATSYNIYRGIQPAYSNTNKIALYRSGIISSSFLDPNAAPDYINEPYEYAVTAVGASGESAPSAMVTATPLPVVWHVTVLPVGLMAGETATVTVHLSGSAPNGGVVVSLRSENSNLAWLSQRSITVPAGNDTATVNVTANPVAVDTPVTIDASTGTVKASGVVTVLAPVAKFAVVEPTVVQAGSPFNVTVIAEDKYGQVRIGYTGQVSIASSDGAATLPATASLTNGVGSFSATLQTGGSQTITATDTQNNALTGASPDITVLPVTSIRVVAPTNVRANVPFTVTLTALDRYFRVESGYNGTAKVWTNAPRATVPATVTFTNGTATFSATFTKEATSAANFKISAADTNTAVNGTSAAIAVGP